MNDLIVTGDDTVGIEKLRHQMWNMFEMSQLADAQFYLGAKLLHDNSRIYLHQHSYIQKLLKQFNMLHCNPVTTPMCPSLKLQADLGESASDQHYYQSLIGGLLYPTLKRNETLASKLVA